jgi:hypothetical protein
MECVFEGMPLEDWPTVSQPTGDAAPLSKEVFNCIKLALPAASKDMCRCYGAECSICYQPDRLDSGLHTGVGMDDAGVVMLAVTSVPLAVAGWIGRTCYMVVKVLGNKKEE